MELSDAALKVDALICRLAATDGEPPTSTRLLPASACREDQLEAEEIQKWA